MDIKDIKDTMLVLINLLDETFDTFETCDECPFTKKCDRVCNNYEMTLCSMISIYNN